MLFYLNFLKSPISNKKNIESICYNTGEIMRVTEKKVRKTQKRIK